MKDTLAIAWCDNGMVDGKFMQGVTDVMLHGGANVVTTLRSSGNQIGRQRETVAKYWYENNKSEWLLWVDSDVVISPDTFKKLWDKRDVEKHPILTGVYFTTDTPEEPLMMLMHRNVITRILEVLPNTPLFTEVGVGKQFMGEDIFFFSLCDRADIPVWCDTSATVPHMKRFSFDVNYYDAFVGDKRK